jgi:radical SAM protein (TIGR01212 family)
VQVEYGVESCFDTTLERINRGHGLAESRWAILQTHARGIATGAHFIFGLPGESMAAMLSYADVISGLPLDSVKFHQLQIVKGTAMERDFLVHPGDFHQFTLPEYIRFIVQFIERLNPSIVIERFSGEIPPRFMDNASQKWDLIRYDAVLRMIEHELKEQDTWQGKRYGIS